MIRFRDEKLKRCCKCELICIVQYQVHIFLRHCICMDQLHMCRKVTIVNVLANISATIAKIRVNCCTLSLSLCFKCLGIIQGSRTMPYGSSTIEVRAFCCTLYSNIKFFYSINLILQTRWKSKIQGKQNVTNRI